jgi:hypothetical protein
MGEKLISTHELFFVMDRAWTHNHKYLCVYIKISEWVREGDINEVNRSGKHVKQQRWANAESSPCNLIKLRWDWERVVAWSYWTLHDEPLAFHTGERERVMGMRWEGVRRNKIFMRKGEYLNSFHFAHTQWQHRHTQHFVRLRSPRTHSGVHHGNQSSVR